MRCSWCPSSAFGNWCVCCTFLEHLRADWPHLKSSLPCVASRCRAGQLWQTAETRLGWTGVLEADHCLPRLPCLRNLWTLSSQLPASLPEEPFLASLSRLSPFPRSGLGSRRADTESLMLLFPAKMAGFLASAPLTSTFCAILSSGRCCCCHFTDEDTDAPAGYKEQLIEQRSHSQYRVLPCMAVVPLPSHLPEPQEAQFPRPGSATCRLCLTELHLPTAGLQASPPRGKPLGPTFRLPHPSSPHP